MKAPKRATLGFQAKSWAASEAQHNRMDAVECKHIVVGPLFPKRISHAFEAKRTELEARLAQGANPADCSACRAVALRSTLLPRPITRKLAVRTALQHREAAQ